MDFVFVLTNNRSDVVNGTTQKKKNKGVVMLVFYSGFVNSDNDSWDNKYACTTVDHAVDHAWHIGK